MDGMDNNIHRSFDVCLMKRSQISCMQRMTMNKQIMGCIKIGCKRIMAFCQRQAKPLHGLCWPVHDLMANISERKLSVGIHKLCT